MQSQRKGRVNNFQHLTTLSRLIRIPIRRLSLQEIKLNPKLWNNIQVSLSLIQADFFFFVFSYHTKFRFVIVDYKCIKIPVAARFGSTRSRKTQPIADLHEAMREGDVLSMQISKGSQVEPEIWNYMGENFYDRQPIKIILLMHEIMCKLLHRPIAAYFALMG